MKIIGSSLAALALAATPLAALIATPAAADPHWKDHDRGRHERWDKHDRRAYRYDYGGRHYEARRWSRGERFDRRYAPRYVVINDYRSHRPLYAPPRGYRWVRSGDDAVLIGITSGLVSAVVSNALR